MKMIVTYAISNSYISSEIFCGVLLELSETYIV
jgi:hypothetical protein